MALMDNKGNNEILTTLDSFSKSFRRGSDGCQSLFWFLAVMLHVLVSSKF